MSSVPFCGCRKRVHAGAVARNNALISTIHPVSSQKKWQHVQISVYCALRLFESSQSIQPLVPAFPWKKIMIGSQCSCRRFVSFIGIHHENCIKLEKLETNAPTATMPANDFQLMKGPMGSLRSVMHSSALRRQTSIVKANNSFLCLKDSCLDLTF
jgi:hypothetical protein